jgi:hypothetical protein
MIISSKPLLILGNLDLQVAFTFPGRKTVYRTITYPPKLASPSYGRRSCLNLTTNKAENIACSKEVVISLISEHSESK